MENVAHVIIAVLRGLAYHIATRAKTNIHDIKAISVGVRNHQIRDRVLSSHDRVFSINFLKIIQIVSFTSSGICILDDSSSIIFLIVSHFNSSLLTIFKRLRYIPVFSMEFISSKFVFHQVIIYKTSKFLEFKGFLSKYSLYFDVNSQPNKPDKLLVIFFL
jgi:hypothetical protein